jgi:hypothetical protein
MLSVLKFAFDVTRLEGNITDVPTQGVFFAEGRHRSNALAF